MATNADDTTPSPATRQLRPKPLTSIQTRPSPMLREDCWSEESTHALIEAWGSHHLALSRGNLRQHHWLQVAAAVNSSGFSHRRRTDIQCKNRIDTLKKKYKVEKAKTVESAGAYVSPWRFFSRLDFLISGGSVGGGGGGGDDSHSSRKLSPETPALPKVLTKFPVAPRSAMQRKRPAVVDESFIRKQLAAVVAAAEEVEAEELRERDSSSGTSSGGGGGEVRREKREIEEEDGGDGFNNGCRRLAEAIMRLGEMYERVEGAKQEQLIELEKHRMQFAKDLEFQRMKLFMDTQLQLAKIKRSKLNDEDADSYL